MHDNKFKIKGAMGGLNAPCLRALWASGASDIALSVNLWHENSKSYVGAVREPPLQGNSMSGQLTMQFDAGQFDVKPIAMPFDAGLFDVGSINDAIRCKGNSMSGRLTNVKDAIRCRGGSRTAPCQYGVKRGRQWMSDTMLAK
jgi:hypothetical protein